MNRFRRRDRKQLEFVETDWVNQKLTLDELVDEETYNRIIGFNHQTD